MTSFFDWLSMGGYANYIWSAYGLVCLVLMMNLLGIRWKKARTRQKLQRWFKRQKSL
jgi:heme exporter protein D